MRCSNLTGSCFRNGRKCRPTCSRSARPTPRRRSSHEQVRLDRLGLDRRLYNLLLSAGGPGAAARRMSKYDWIGWLATAVFTTSYFSRTPVTLRRVQGVAALAWAAYGI